MSNFSCYQFTLALLKLVRHLALMSDSILHCSVPIDTLNSSKKYALFICSDKMILVLDLDRIESVKNKAEQPKAVVKNIQC